MGETARQIPVVTHYNSTSEAWQPTQRILQSIGVKGAARAVGVSERAVYQWGEDPARSGVLSPIQRFLDFARHVTSFHDEKVNAELLELLGPVFEQMEIEPVSQKVVADLRRLLAQVAPSDRRLDETKATTICPRCDDPLEPMPVAGGWYCKSCGRE